jgi:2-polyprenyl-6-methoxyphenol hydroxylase-like FAD-dependent oxidoreductase
MAEALSTRCLVTGGGPAGMMLGYLLARAGVDTIVLEKHADFFRDFRGDTIHPSTLELMYELGILEEFLKLPHDEVTGPVGVFNGFPVKFVDFSHVPTHCKFLVFMPQWDFLDFIAAQAKKYAAFRLMMQTEATGILLDGDTVAGVRAQTPQGEIEIRADLTVAADGRHSILRQKANFEIVEFGAPMDVLWMRVSRRPSDPGQAFGFISSGKIFVMLARGTYWQCGYVIPKGAFEEIQRAGLRALQETFAATVPFIADRVVELDSWDKIKLLTVQVDRLKQWYRAGMLCIGDAAHAMSPIGGIGINLAVQDAVAAANILYRPLLAGRPTLADLRKVQKRRTFPTVMTQHLQLFLQKNALGPVLAGVKISKPPLALRTLSAVPLLQRIPARLMGVGFRPEHIHTPDAFSG